MISEICFEFEQRLLDKAIGHENGIELIFGQILFKINLLGYDMMFQVIWLSIQFNLISI